MSEHMTRPVVLGVDGSSSAVAAVEVAAQEAAALGVGLRIVHAYVWPLFYASLANVPYRPEDWEPGAQSRAMVDAVARRTRANHPDLEVHTVVRAGGGGAVLVEESAEAALVVLGGRGIGGVAGMLAGPVAGYVAMHARCPVIVAREGQRRPRLDAPVVVGLDGSADALAALEYARGWAARRDAVVQTRTVEGPDAASTLIDVSRSARMIVVGAPRSGESPLVRALVRGAHCAVAVVHVVDDPLAVVTG
jgi:nucleotide-binding universal stress UspA family protein